MLRSGLKLLFSGFCGKGMDKTSILKDNLQLNLFHFNIFLRLLGEFAKIHPSP